MISISVTPMYQKFKVVYRIDSLLYRSCIIPNIWCSNPVLAGTESVIPIIQRTPSFTLYTLGILSQLLQQPALLWLVHHNLRVGNTSTAVVTQKRSITCYPQPWGTNSNSTPTIMSKLVLLPNLMADTNSTTNGPINVTFGHTRKLDKKLVEGTDNNSLSKLVYS